MKILKASVYAFLIFFYLCPPAGSGYFSSDMDGTTGGVILKLEGSARDISMGASLGADAVFSNPAGLAAGGADFTALHARLIEDVHFSQLAAALDYKENTIGFYGAYLGMDEIDSYKADGYPAASTYSPYHFSGGLYISRRVGESAFYGGGIKGVFQYIDGDRARALAADVGYLRKDENVVTAVSLRNMGTELKFRRKSDLLPVNLNAALSWHSPLEGLLLCLNVTFPIDNDPSFHGGGEYVYRAGEINLKPRFGYNTARARDHGALYGFTAGAGIGFRVLAVDYAWLPWGETGSTHRVSLSYTASPVEPPPEKEYIYDLKEKRRYIELFYMKGFRSFGEGDFIRAADYFERVLELDPRHRRAREYLQRIEKR